MSYFAAPVCPKVLIKRVLLNTTMFIGQLKKLEESMAADGVEIEKLRGEEKEKLKVCSFYIDLALRMRKGFTSIMFTP